LFLTFFSFSLKHFSPLFVFSHSSLVLSFATLDGATETPDQKNKKNYLDHFLFFFAEILQLKKSLSQEGHFCRTFDVFS